MEDLLEKNNLAHLISTGASILGTSGEVAITVRSLAQLAGVSPTTVQHHFPTRTCLLAAIYDEAIKRDMSRLAQLDAAVRQAGVPNGEAALGLVQGLIADACGANSERTLARISALIGIGRGRTTGGRRKARAWAARSREFLARALHDITPAPRRASRFLLEFLTGIELASLGCRQSPLLPLLNAELVAYGFEVAIGLARPRCPAWFNLCAAQALQQSHEESAKSGTGKTPRALQDILAASARILAGDGPGELTYRNAAKAAGVATSLVGYHFRSKNDLLYAAYRYIHDQFARDIMAASVPLKSTGLQAGLDLVIDTPAGPKPAYVASLEAVVASAYEAGMTDLAWKTRMTRGVYYLHPRWDADSRLGAVDFTVHALSIWTLGATLIAESCCRPPATIACLRRRFAEAERIFPNVRGAGKS
ncbi:TetR/AcrR family transcriptional regulator [Cupriavidus necator]|uniref:TetR/AcrR family transcriptional regulator n=1 Tax=Cupriavidus necator TaxID=106590 RepID=A0A1U9UW04_CUPNE|nr:TetR/AcrR family transcriptional regulator [Cupriavidus necator]AQV96862.1 TetR/AcrR family transcriptional regulator [Cupriavidus necator]